MNALAANTIISDIDAHMLKSGIRNGGWYVGITSDIEERLFGHHKVPKQNHWYIWRHYTDANAARTLETAYHRAGCKGSAGGGDNAAVYIYAYAITGITVE
jgi:hypothetical protein